MLKRGLLIILGLLALLGLPVAQAAPAVSDWPSLNFDAARSNNNSLEKTITFRNILKLKVRWTSPMADGSYPIVSSGHVLVPHLAEGGKIHVKALDAVTGKQVIDYTKDASGGLLARDGVLYLAGHILQIVDPTSGAKLEQINPSPKLQGGTFLDPVADAKLILAGYAGTKIDSVNALYGLNPSTHGLIWKLPSASASATIGTGRILTRTATGTVFYDESTGRKLTTKKAVFSDWFAGNTLAYTVASVKRGNTMLFAFDGTGQQVWKRVVAAPLYARGWPHAVTSDAVYVATLKPRIGVEALDPLSGSVLWFRPVPDVQQMAFANGVLFMLTYRLGQPVRLIAIRATSGAVIGAIVLQSGYYLFPGANGLMVANGMVFVRAVGPGGSLLVALGL